MIKTKWYTVTGDVWELLSPCRFASLDRALLHSNWLSNKLLVDVRHFVVEMMAVTTDGSLLWQTPACDGEDATCIQRSLSLHFLLAISIMWLILYLSHMPWRTRL